MAEPGVLIIDDVAASLAKASPQGQGILTQSAAVVREQVCALAARRGWTIVSHEHYSAWARGRIAKSACPWVNLDPLFEWSGAGPSVQPLRFSRLFGQLGQGLEGPLPTLTFADSSNGVGIVDDVVASGRTVRLADQIIRHNGGVTSRLAVCAAGPRSFQSLKRRVPGVSLEAYLPDEWWVTHLRDGCPHLPFSGRPSGLAVPSFQGAAQVELRILARHVAGNPWQGIALDRSVREAMSAAQRAVAEELTKLVGRPARIGDLGVLGANVPALIEPGGTAVSETLIESLLPVSSVQDRP